MFFVVVTEDVKIDNPIYKEKFWHKAKILLLDEVEIFIGHAVTVYVRLR
ncbi:MAG: hypothetical protein HFG28_11705 [Eubacterium sp.]|nr:hypothetical protein [Eubacterium sp.]